MTDQELNIKLVGAVEKQEVLYNYTLPGYTRKDLTERAWKEVSIEVDMPVQDCKDKWKNLRTVFMRKLKPSSNGSGGKKKAYYLENAMQFCLPFIRTSIPPQIGTLPAPFSSTQPSICETEDSDTDIDDPTQFVKVESTEVPPNPPPMPPSLQHHPTSSPSKTSSKIETKNKRTASVADQAMAEYFKAKRAKLQSNVEANASIQKIDKQQGIKMFLLSLIPELDELSSAQIKLFKRQVLRVIDDISLLEHH